jgi:hypothetical protein
MCLTGINNKELYPVAILAIQALGSSAPLPEGRSGKGAENHYHWFLSQQPGEDEFIAVNILQFEINGFSTFPQADSGKTTAGPTGRLTASYQGI